LDEAYLESWVAKKESLESKHLPFLDGGNSNMFLFDFQPDPWGNSLQFDYVTFCQMGWFNHQLDFVSSVLNGTSFFKRLP